MAMALRVLFVTPTFLGVVQFIVCVNVHFCFYKSMFMFKVEIDLFFVLGSLVVVVVVVDSFRMQPATRSVVCLVEEMMVRSPAVLMRI